MEAANAHLVLLHQELDQAGLQVGAADPPEEIARSVPEAADPLGMRVALLQTAGLQEKVPLHPLGKTAKFS